MRLAIVATHPIQYYAPWFKRVAAEPGFDLKVFYLWDFGVTEKHDKGFERAIRWDLPLLDGYAHEFVENTSLDPGTHHFRGIRNPQLPDKLRTFDPDAILLYGYNFVTHQRLIWQQPLAPLIFRGDSHRLVPGNGVREFFRHRWIKSVFRRFAAFLPVGQANRAYFKYHGVPDNKLFFAPHAVDNVRFTGAEAEAIRDAAAWRNELGIPPGNRVVLFAGKFQPKKRPNDLIAAFLALNLDDVSLLLVGDGEMEAALRAQAGAHPRIHFASFQNQSLMPRTYALADLFVLPSQGRDETWGLAVNEAMCLGKPVIVSSHVGCALDLVRSGENGRVFRAGVIPALTHALRDALSDPDRLAKWGEKSRHRGRIHVRPRTRWAEAGVPFPRRHFVTPSNSTSRPRVQLWCPELFGVGGIQAYSRQFLHALLESANVELIDVLSRNDEKLPTDLASVPTARITLCARNGETASRFRFAAALLRAGVTRRPDLIITTHLFFAPVARWLKRLAGIPYWTVVHGVQSWGALRPTLISALRDADRVLAVSRFSRDRVIENQHLTPSRVAILPNTFDVSRFRPEPRSPVLLERYGLGHDQPIILTVARMEASERYKGIDEMLAIFPEVLKAVPNARYLILGEGTDRARLEQVVRERGLQSAVTFGGNVPPEDLCAHYNLCDLFAMPSRGEGFGIVFLEALACGKPVLAGNQDGSVDPLRDGELGVLVDPGNPEELRDAVIAVLLKRLPHPNIYSPDYLRDQVIAHFGIERFRSVLDAELRDFFIARDPSH